MNQDRSEAEWKDILSPEQYEVLRRRGTEQPFTGKYYRFKEDVQSPSLALYQEVGQ